MSTPSKNSPRKWTAEEDECLRSVVEKMGPRNWKEIAKHVPDRSHVQCLQRWNKVLRPGLKKGTWQNEEDDRLTNEVNAFLEAGLDVNWSVISRCIEGRTAKQCRERWRCNLDPQINKTEWTVEEDLMIVNLQRELGNRWALLAKSLPGRTENAIKTRFRSLQRSNKRKWSPQEDSLLMQMIRSGSNFEEVSQVMTRRSLNSVRVRYKQLSEGSQAATVSPPRAAVFAALSNPSPAVQQQQQMSSSSSSNGYGMQQHQQHHQQQQHQQQMNSSYSSFPPLLYATQPLDHGDFSSPGSFLEMVSGGGGGGKRSAPSLEFDDDHSSKLQKLEVF